MKKRSFLAIFIIILYVTGCASSKYAGEIKSAHDYIDSHSKKTISNWQDADVSLFTPLSNFEIFDEKAKKQVNIVGKKTLAIRFKTNQPELGDIIIYVDKENKKVLGIGGRK